VSYIDILYAEMRDLVCAERDRADAVTKERDDLREQVEAMRAVVQVVALADPSDVLSSLKCDAPNGSRRWLHSYALDVIRSFPAAFDQKS
jgi:hypothetical protein